MARLKVTNVPDDLYAALKKRARLNGRSMAAEVRALLHENFPTARELRKRRAAFRAALASHPADSVAAEPPPAAQRDVGAVRKGPLR